MDKTPWIVCFVACVCVEVKDLWYSWLKVSVWNCIYDKMTGIRNNILTCLYDTWWMRSLLFGTVWVFGVHSIMVKVKKKSYNTGNERCQSNSNENGNRTIVNVFTMFISSYSSVANAMLCFETFESKRERKCHRHIVYIGLAFTCKAKNLLANLHAHCSLYKFKCLYSLFDLVLVLYSNSHGKLSVKISCKSNDVC